LVAATGIRTSPCTWNLLVTSPVNHKGAASEMPKGVLRTGKPEPHVEVLK
jgi:hypothetical protein